MRIGIRPGTLALATALAAVGCGGSDAPEETPRDIGAGGAEPTVEFEGPYEVFDSFDIAIDQTVSVGSFDLHLKDAEVRSGDDTFEEPRLVFEFTADNQSSDGQLPLQYYTGEKLRLDIDGKHFYGGLDHDQKVPGYEMGENAFLWRIDDPEITPEQIRSGTITIGEGDTNQVVIPLDALEDTVTLNRLPLDDVELTGIHAGHRAVLDENRIQFNYHSENRLLERDKAWLVFRGQLFGGDEFSCLELDRYKLERPNGTSIIADAGRYCAYPGDVEDYGFRFVLEQPIAGEYEITIQEDPDIDGDQDVVFTVVVP